MSRPTVSQVKGWNIGALADASAVASTNAQNLDTAMDSVVRAFDKEQRWQGQTHDAANSRLKEERDHASEIKNVLNQIADESDDAARDLGNAQTLLNQYVDGATKEECSVADDGTVTSTADPEDTEKASTWQAKIQGVLDSAGELDDKYGASLETLSTDLAGMVNGQPDIALPDGSKADPDDVVDRLSRMSPDERARFMEQLSPEATRALIQANPEVLDKLDGVPFPVRFAAGDINVRNALIDEQQKPNPDPARVNRLKELLTPITDPITGKTVERQIMSFSVDGNGRMIQMFGHIDSNTKNVGVYVPGTTTNLNGSGTNDKAAWNLANQSGGPVVLYMDGDFPQKLGYEGLGWQDLGYLAGAGGTYGGTLIPLINDVTGSMEGSAADPRFAETMAPKLVSFGNELDRTIDAVAPGAKTTYIGHSYGGSIVGSAEQLGLDADRVIYASSAGTGVFEGGWNNPNPNVERYSMTAPGDMIQYVQGLDNVGLNPHGGDPDVTPGVTRMDTGYYHSDPDGDGPIQPGQLVEGTAAHGKYWDDPKSDAFQNMSKVIRGEDPSLYVDRAPDTVFDAVGDKVEEIQEDVAPAVEVITEVADGDIDLGPISIPIPGLPSIPGGLKLW